MMTEMTKERIALWIVNKMNLACELFDIDMYALVILTIIFCAYLLAMLPEVKEENILRLRKRVKMILIPFIKAMIFVSEAIWNYVCIPVIRMAKTVTRKREAVK